MAFRARVGLRARVLLIVAGLVVPALLLIGYNALEDRDRAYDDVGADAQRAVHAAAESQRGAVARVEQLLLGLSVLPDVRGGDDARCAAILADVQARFPEYANLGMARPDGDLTCSALPFQGPVSSLDRSWFQRAIATDGFVIGDYQVGRVTGVQTINFAVPVHDGSGRLVGVLFAALHLEVLRELTAGIALHDDATLLVLDTQGTVLMHHPDPGRWVGEAPTDAPVVDAALGGTTQVVELAGLDGTKRLYAFERVAGDADRGLVSVAAGIPTAVAFAAVKQQFAQSVLVLADLGIVVGAAAWILTDRYVVRAEERRLEAERALARQGRETQAILRVAGEGVLRFDRDGIISFANPAALRFLDTTDDALVGQPVHVAAGHRTVDGSPAPADACMACASLTTGGTHGGTDVLFTRTDGTTFPVEYMTTPLWEGDDVIGAVVTFRDITQRRRAEESRARIAAIVDSSYDAIYAQDLDGTILTWNPAAQDMYGYAAEEMVGRNVSMLLPAGQKEEAAAILAKVRAGERVDRYETRSRRSDGALIEVSLTVSPIRDPDGRLVGASAIARDITAEKQAESALAAAKAAAEEATRAKSEFLANMSHEIRTPMNAIIGMTTLLADSDLTPEQREFVDTVRGAGESLLTLINDILDLSKVEAGRLELEQEPFDLRACAEEAVDLMAVKAGQKGLELACAFEPRVPAGIVGDAGRLRQVLLNLIGNAVKFTQAGEVVVWVDAQRLDDGRHELHVAVSDTGIGMPAALRDRLFQPFTQADASTTRRYGGTGLGLAIAKRLVELMGGSIWVESAEGRGSTFHFTVVAKEATLPGTAAEPVAPVSVRDRHVLIVDDNATNRRILELQTRAWGMLPHPTASPREALAWVQRGDHFDVALLDISMPEMDGVELARALRRHADAATLPLIFLTSLGRRREEAEAADVGFSAFLAKPIKRSTLFDALIGALGQRPVRPAAARPGTLPRGSRPGLRVLLVEDNAVNQKVAVRLLQRLGYNPDVASNGVEAIAALERATYDVVLMDVQMPEMDGLEATRQILERWHQGRPRIVAMTAHASEEDRAECLAAGMDDYVSKPVDIHRLAQALERVEPHAAAPSPSAPPEQPAQPGPLDARALVQLRSDLGGDRDAMDELIASYLAEAQRLVAELRLAAESGDAHTAERAAHTLKSTSATFGATRLAGMCQEVEHAARAGDTDAPRARLAAIEAEAARVRDALERTRGA